MNRKGPAQYALLFGLLLLLGVFLLTPIWLTVRGGFYEDVTTRTGFTFDHVALVFADPALREGLINAFMIAVATTTLSVLIALPLSVLSANYKFPLKGFWNAVILVPLILPPFVGAIGLRMLLGKQGALNELLGTEWDILGSARFWGVVVAQALHLYPIIYLNATAALANLDPAMDEAAENLGAGPWKRFMTITLPMIRPGLFAGCTIVFIWAFTELGTPLMFDFYTVTPVQIFDGIKEVDTSATPYALTAVMLFFAILSYVTGKAMFGGRAHASTTRASRAGGEKQLSPVMSVVAIGLFGVVTAFALLPHLGVVLASVAGDGSWYQSVLPKVFTFEHYEDALGHPVAFGSIKNSLIYASLAVIVDIGLGLLIGYMLVRTKVKGRTILDALSMLPLAVPGLVMAFGFVAMSIMVASNWPFSGEPLSVFGVFHIPSLPTNLQSLGTVIGADANPIMFLVIAYAVRRLPYVVRATVAGLEQTSGELEEAAVNLGASTMTAVRKIIVPLIMANLIAGGLLAFSFAMLEVSDSLILAQKAEHYPITKAIYTFAERLGDGFGIASAMGVWGMALLTVTLVGASVLIGKKLGAIFRV